MNCQTEFRTSAAEENQLNQGQIFYDKKYVPKLCQVPWNTMGVNQQGEVYICSSPSWIPKFVGNIIESDAFDVLNSPTAILIRQEIKAGRYFYCNNKICDFFKQNFKKNFNRDISHHPTTIEDITPLTIDQLDDSLKVTRIPRNLIFDFDYTCNFVCPSCRTDIINNNKNIMIRPVNNIIVDRIKNQIIDQIQFPTEIRWCGGEPFISEPYLELFEYISRKNNPNIHHIIQTNGSYLKKKKDLLESLLPSIKVLRISFDAATEQTYKKIRVNGVWDTLIENVIWINNLIKEKNYKTSIRADFVVQLDNYHEMPAFVELCKKLNLENGISFQKMWNWGTWSQEEFDHKNIYNPNHPEYKKLVAVFESVGKRP